MVNLLQEDLKWCLRRLPKNVFELLKSEDVFVMLAGGYIRALIANEKPSDIDLFVSSKNDAELCARRLTEKEGRLIETKNAITVVTKGRPTVQFITRWLFSAPEELINSFDYTVARAVIWFGRKNDGQSFNHWVGLCDDRFYSDLAAKRLTYCSPKRIEEAGGSMLRVLKFYQRGYRIPLDSLGAVIARVASSVEWDKTSGDERHVALIITGLLREVDPDIDPTHVSHLPSKSEEIVDETTERV